MSLLTPIRKLIRNSVRRDRIVRLTKDAFGENTFWTARIFLALDITTEEYKGKIRRNGDRRIDHERQMYLIYLKHLNGRDPVVALAILLHDLHEDNRSKWPLYKIEAMFGKEVVDLVRAVTKPRMSLAEQVSVEGSQKVADRVRKGGERAMILKCIDRLHFFLKPYEFTDRNKLIWKVAQTMDHIQAMAREVGVLVSELELATAYCLWKNNITTEELNEFA